MGDIIDISVNVKNGMPTWPGSVGFKLWQVSHLDHGDTCNVCAMQLDVHVGTHIDAPWHFLQDGTRGDSIPMERFVGEAYVASLPAAKSIGAEELASIRIPEGTTRLLLKTSNSDLWTNDTHEFTKDFVAITADGAQWIVDNGIQTLGVDYLSVQRFYDDSTTHQVLLSAKTAIIEGLNLSGASEGTYELICLPLKLIGTDGAPARAILRPYRRD